MVHPLDRRMFLQVFGGVALLAGGGGASFAQKGGQVARLIHAARGLEPISARIEFISHALLGTRYRANTLIGGPRQPEQFVVRDDAFDCVTYCEVVLAAALARDYGAFDLALRKIRYADGVVRWDRRNHYFAEWIRRAVENGIGQPVALPQAVTIEKTVRWSNLGRRRVSILGVPTDAALAHPDALASGDIIGFVSKRENLDFFHTGLVMRGPHGELNLRHAAQSRRRVVEEPMALFVVANGVRHVALLRPTEMSFDRA